MSAITYDPLHRSSIQSLSVEVAKFLGALSFGRQQMSVSLAVVQMYDPPGAVHLYPNGSETHIRATTQPSN